MTTEVRQQAAHPGSSYLVQAPAGSGKTELLTQRILALLAVVDEPEEILALTFTRKAAAEMLNRVIGSLSMERPEDNSSHKMDTFRLAERALKRSSERGWQLIENPNRLRIMTLDSLTGSLARQLPLLSGLGEMPTPSEHAVAAYREAAESTLDEAIRRDSMAVETLLLHLDHNMVQLIELMSGMLGSREQWLGYIGAFGRDTGQLRQMLETNMAGWMLKQLQYCHDLIPVEFRTEIIQFARFAAANGGNPALDTINQWPDCTLETISTWQLLSGFLLTGSSASFKKRLTKNEGFPPPAAREKAAMTEILTQLAAIPGAAEALHGIRELPENARLDENQWQVLQALFELLPLAVAKLQQIFSSNGSADFTEIALRALDALTDANDNPSDLLLKLDYRMHHILVDEFQDTSELQIKLLRCLTSGWQQEDGRTLFMVGDPMQSIYRFRKAEVGLFLQAADNSAELPPITEHRLVRNFRSAPAIVDWVNRAFASIFPTEQNIINGAISHASADAALTHQGKVCLHLQEHEDEMAEASKIVHLIRSARERDQCIGILSRTRKQLHAIMPALSDAGIPFRAVKILPLNSQPEVHALRALTRALLHPADRVAWAALLRAPCCGLSRADMFALMAGDERSLWEIIREESCVARLTSNAMERVIHLKEAIEPCMDTSGKIAVRKLVETAWLRLGMPGYLNATEKKNVETVLDLLDELDGDTAVAGFIDFDLFDERLEKLYAAPDSSKEAARVELMTMHGAKGLQWEVVILPSLGKPPKSSHSPLLAFTNIELDHTSALLIAAKAETRSRDAHYKIIQQIEKEREGNELARLLYVATTRAETELHMFGHLSNSGKASKGSLLSLLLKQGDNCFGAQVSFIEDGETAKTNQRLPLQRFKTVAEIITGSESQAGQVVDQADEENNQETTHEIEFGWAGAEAAPIGNTLHAILQQIAEHGVESWNSELTAQAIQTMRRILIAEGLSGELLTSALSRCTLGMEQALKSQKGQWILSGKHDDAHCEWPLSTLCNGRASHRIIDRSFIDECGTRWIIDYKTASHEGGNLEQFLDREQQRHTRQMEGYRDLLQRMDSERPVRVALYFPIVDGWREL
jgi:ATP-dependent helicase/nuclease subunit A